MSPITNVGRVEKHWASRMLLGRGGQVVTTWSCAGLHLELVLTAMSKVGRGHFDSWEN